MQVLPASAAVLVLSCADTDLEMVRSTVQDIILSVYVHD